jgi:hypothetical protein
LPHWLKNSRGKSVKVETHLLKYSIILAAAVIIPFTGDISTIAHSPCENDQCCKATATCLLQCCGEKYGPTYWDKDCENSYDLLFCMTNDCHYDKKNKSSARCKHFRECMKLCAKKHKTDRTNCLVNNCSYDAKRAKKEVEKNTCLDY